MAQQSDQKKQTRKTEPKPENPAPSGHPLGITIVTR